MISAPWHQDGGHPWAPDTEVGDLNQLIILLGGSPDSFRGQLAHLVCKADHNNQRRLALAYPAETIAVVEWLNLPSRRTVRWWQGRISHLKGLALLAHAEVHAPLLAMLIAAQHGHAAQLTARPIPAPAAREDPP